MDAGNFYDIPKEQEEVIRQWLNSGSSHLNALKPILSRLSFHMDTLVVAPNSYICPSKFDNEQGAPYRARMIFEEVLLRAPKAVGKKYHEKIEGKVSLPPGYRYDDIFHLSVSRIVKKTGDENFLEFAKEANETIGRNLHENPLIITSDEVILGRPIELYQRFAPHLLNE